MLSARARLSAILRSSARFLAALRSRTRLASSRKTTSSTQWSPFSTPQWFRMAAASRSGGSRASGYDCFSGPSGKRRDEALQALREPSHDGVRERHRSFAPGGANELDGVVDDRVHRLVAPRKLVGAEPERGSHRWIELANGALAELLDPEVDRPPALHRPVGESLRERAVAVVEPLDGRGERTIGVGPLLEDAAHDFEGGATCRGDHRRPRRNSS